MNFVSQVRGSLLAPGGLHPGVHDGAGPHGRAHAPLPGAERQAPRAVRRRPDRPRRLGERTFFSYLQSNREVTLTFRFQDIKSYCPDIPGDFPYPIVADPERKLAVQLGMIDEEGKDQPELAMTIRALYIVSPDHRLRLAMHYPTSTGRNVE